MRKEKRESILLNEGVCRVEQEREALRPNAFHRSPVAREEAVCIIMNHVTLYTIMDSGWDFLLYRGDAAGRVGERAEV